MSTIDRFRTVWEHCGGKDADAVWATLDAGYTEPARAYHNWAHIEAMLAGLDKVSQVAGLDARQRDEIELAIFFHDAVYDPLVKDNEAQSASLFRQMTAENGDFAADAVSRVADMNGATTEHKPSADPATQVLLDLDLAILGSSAETYRDYVAAVRREYAFVSDSDWRAGRAALMRRFLERQHIYQTSQMATREPAARANIENEIKNLTDHPA